MKPYSSDEIKSWSWLKRQKYIHSSDSLGTGESVSWQLIEKFPISKIEYDGNKYPNKLNMSEVLFMIGQFYPFGYVPIRIDMNYNLLDGQHRLKFAELCGLEFIDVWIDNNLK
jgi:hypothetical protein